MFGLFKSKKIRLFSPLDGKIIGLENVPDEVFSKGMVGDGVAIEPISSTVVSPIKGLVSRVFPTKHAFSIRSSDIDVLIHIGLDTVELDGEGFELMIQEGDMVEIGTPMVRIDKEYIESRGKSSITPIVISSSKRKISIKKFKEGLSVREGELILEVEF